MQIDCQTMDGQMMEGDDDEQNLTIQRIVLAIMSPELMVDAMGRWKQNVQPPKQGETRHPCQLIPRTCEQPDSASPQVHHKHMRGALITYAANARCYYMALGPR